MRKENRSARSIIALSAIILAVLALFSRDWRKADYLSLDEKLTEVNLLSYELNDELVKVRAGFVVNYDSIVDASARLRAANNYFLAETIEKTAATDAGRLFIYQLKGQALALDTSAIQSYIDQRLELISTFKSEFSIYKNAQMASYHLVDELRGVVTPSRDWVQHVNELEYLVLRNNRDAFTEIEVPVLEKIDLLLSGNINSYQRECLEFLRLHINNIRKYSPHIHELILAERAATDRLHESIASAKQQLRKSYETSSQSSRAFGIALSVMALFTVVYGGIQAGRALRYSNLIEKQNENLESRVEERTLELQQVTDQLQAEAIEKQNMIENLQRKDEELATREEFFRTITETATDPIILIDQRGQITFHNSATTHVFGYEQIDMVGQSIATLLPGFVSVTQLIDAATHEIEGQRKSGPELKLKISINEVNVGVGENYYACILHDITEFKQLENDLAHAQKLESVGQLAAGIAHEINTPAQFISDNLVFLHESVDDMFGLIEGIGKLVQEDGEPLDAEKVSDLIDQADIEYLSDEVPTALKQSSEGIERVATIVRAMKDYSHPGESMEFSDLNAALESTITVSRSEWKYYAELDTEFDAELPMVQCVVSDINQVVLNMIVNAAHAIVDRYDNPDEKHGLIKIKTCAESDSVVIKVSDNGNGMPPEVKARIFEQFFTTKEVGKGTGQGLSIAHRLIVEKHGGKVDVESQLGEGTTFIISLPVVQPDSGADLAEITEDNRRAC